MYSNRPFPSAISHRGLRASAPENTIAAFEAAIEGGAEGIELDVHASADGMVYVHHDFTFASQGGQTAFVSADSATVNASRLPGDNAVPALDDVLEAIGTRARVYIEIKALNIENDVARCVKRHAERQELYAVHAFDHRVVKRMIELVPSLRTGILQVGYPVDSRTAMRAAGASDLWQHADFVDERLVSDVHAMGGRIIVWTPNTVAEWQRLSSLGVDGICTDKVDEYVAWRGVEKTQHR